MKLLLLAGNTLRSKSYAQQLSKIDGIDISGLFFGFPESQESSPPLNNETRKYLEESNINIPDFSETLVTTFQKNGWPFSMIDTKDVNSNEIIEYIAQLKPDVVVFSGYGGQILKQNHFDLKIPYLHMHPGKLPSERGSTTLYYSILNQTVCSVSAFLMTADIDAGEVIVIKEYKIPNKGMDMDSYFDNCIRADCFGQAIKNFDQRSIPNGKEENNEYYVIHPLLKHISLMSMK